MALAVPVAQAARPATNSAAVALAPSISAGSNHNCSVRTGGIIVCWGDNSYGQTARPSGTYTAVTAGQGFSCALSTGSTLSCWGLSTSGQTSAPTGTYSALSAGSSHACAIKTDSTLACWGYNYWGQTTSPSGTFVAVSAGGGHSCAIKTDSTLACWGRADNGISTPPAGTYTALDAGLYHSCAIATGGSLACWGSSLSGEATPPAGTFGAVSAGSFYTCAIKADQTLICWGANTSGEATPPPGTFLAVSAGDGHACALRTDATIVCWGSNYSGETVPPFPPVVRYSGTGRFDTAAQISAHTFGSPCNCTAYIAYAYNFPDALAGAAAAGRVQGPVLLVDSTGPINSATAAELTRLKPYRIIVLGSAGVISPAVETALNTYATGYVVRYGGANRFATAAVISLNTFPVGIDMAAGPSAPIADKCYCTAYIAYAYNFPDALAGAAAAGTVTGPILLVNTAGPIPAATATELTRLKPDQIVVLGSTSVISAGVMTALDSYAPGHVVRYFGASRFETAAAISANTFAANCGCVAYIAYAYNFPDALAGAAAAGLIHGPVLLVNSTGTINSATAAELTRLQPNRIVVLGSEAVISADVFSALGAYAPTP
jgi:putative cell wall-binding protein